jgi:hypothetical protein
MWMMSYFSSKWQPTVTLLMPVRTGHRAGWTRSFRFAGNLTLMFPSHLLCHGFQQFDVLNFFSLNLSFNSMIITIKVHDTFDFGKIKYYCFIILNMLLCSKT